MPGDGTFELQDQTPAIKKTTEAGTPVTAQAARKLPRRGYNQQELIAGTPVTAQKLNRFRGAEAAPTLCRLARPGLPQCGRTLRGPNKATKEIGTPVTAQQRGSCRRKRDNQRKPCGPPGTLERWNLNVGGALARRPAIVNVTTRQSRPEAPPSLAAYPLWILEFLGTLERRKES